MTEKDNSRQTVTLEEAEEQVIRTARRLALFYHYAAEVLVEELGPEKGREFLGEIVSRYGTDSGIVSRAKVLALGLPLTADNFKKGSDLPAWGWKGGVITGKDGVQRDMITYCPLAEVWKEKGSGKLGRIYCSVDQAKYSAYNGTECRHLKNILDGDHCCLFDLREPAK